MECCTTLDCLDTAFIVLFNAAKHDLEAVAEDSKGRFNYSSGTAVPVIVCCLYLVVGNSCEKVVNNLSDMAKAVSPIQ